MAKKEIPSFETKVRPGRVDLSVYIGLASRFGSTQLKGMTGGTGVEALGYPPCSNSGSRDTTVRPTWPETVLKTDHILSLIKCLATQTMRFNPWIFLACGISTLTARHSGQYFLEGRSWRICTCAFSLSKRPFADCVGIRAETVNNPVKQRKKQLFLLVCFRSFESAPSEELNLEEAQCLIRESDRNGSFGKMNWLDRSLCFKKARYGKIFKI